MRCILLFFLVGCPFLAFKATSQQIVVRNKDNKKPVENVLIYSQHKISAQTNGQGIAHLHEFKNDDILSFQHPSFKRVTLAYKTLKKNGFSISLEPTIIQIDEVVVSASRWRQNKDEIANKITSVNPASIKFHNPQTSADLLESTGQVFIQKSQLGGGSPIIRGFAANSVLIVMDNIRMNNAIFRGGNLQNVISIDPLIIENTEVVYGPGSVIYGSDALGGVMHFKTKTPKFSVSKDYEISGNAMSRYASANNEKTGHFDFNIKKRKFSALTSFTFSEFEDLRTGSNRTDEFPDFGKRLFITDRQNGEDVIKVNDEPNLQIPSGYNQVNALQKLKWRANSSMDVTYTLNYSRTSDVPRYDRLIETDDDGDPVSAEWFYGPQVWVVNAIRSSFFNKNKFYDEAGITVAHQFFKESRNDRKFNDNGLRERTEKVNVASLNLDFEKIFKSENKFFYGSEFVYNAVNSEGIKTNIENGTTEPTTPRYPDGGSNYTSAAIYGSYLRNLSKSITLNSGIRYNHILINASLEDDSIIDFPFEKLDLSNGSLSGNLGLIYKTNKNWQLSGLFSTGFRSPNIDDVGKIFDGSDGFVQVPNENLKPEHTFNWEVNLNKSGEKIDFEIVGFYSILKDAMLRSNFTFNGQDSIFFDGELSRVQALQNFGRAKIYGASAKFNYRFNEKLRMTHTFTFTDGKVTDQEDNTVYDFNGREIVLGSDIPLRHTAPPFGRSSFTYESLNFRYEFYISYNGKRSAENFSPSELSKPHLYTADGSLAWYTLNFKAQYTLNGWTINGGIENILDKHYRPYSSGISAPGRNFILSLRYSF